MTVNVELLDRTLAYIEAHPEEWTQEHYRCRSGCCFAGHAALLSGARWASNNSNAADVKAGDGHPLEMVWERAARVLGLTGEEADDLFSPGNKLDDLRRIVADLKAGAS